MGYDDNEVGDDDSEQRSSSLIQDEEAIRRGSLLPPTNTTCVCGFECRLGNSVIYYECPVCGRILHRDDEYIRMPTLK